MRRVLFAFALLFVSCGITRVDAPITLRSDRRLEIVSPKQEAVLGVPVRVTWSVKDFSTAAGRQFGLFVDRPPVGPNKFLRMRICSEQEKRPIAPGEFRRPCHEDAKTIRFTQETAYDFACFDTNLNQAKRTRNQHEVTVVLLDAHLRRVGEAAARVRFEIPERDARRCRGL